MELIRIANIYMIKSLIVMQKKRRGARRLSEQ